VRARVPGLLIYAALSAVALVLVHDLAFLLTYGSAAGDMLTRTGHDGRWTDAVVLVLSIGGAMLGAACWRVTSLVRSIHEAGGAEVRSASHGAPLRMFLAQALTIAVASGILFLLQENVEHLAGGEAMPGLGVLCSAEYPVTLPLLVLVAIALAGLATLFRLRIAALERLLARARPPLRRPALRQRRAPLIDVLPLRSRLGRGFALRAPPSAAL